MLRIIFLIIIVYILYRLVKGMFPKKDRIPKSQQGGVIDQE
jgi:hypothetical protein